MEIDKIIQHTFEKKILINVSDISNTLAVAVADSVPTHTMLQCGK